MSAVSSLDCFHVKEVGTASRSVLYCLAELEDNLTLHGASSTTAKNDKEGSPKPAPHSVASVMEVICEASLRRLSIHQQAVGFSCPIICYQVDSEHPTRFAYLKAARAVLSLCIEIQSNNFWIS